VTFLGIDGGGSKTAFLLEDEQGRELARLETGPSNWISSGPDKARESISRGILSLPSVPDVVCGGFAGAGRAEGIEFYRHCLSHLLPKARLFIEIDAHIAYVGAIGLKPGLLVMAGTGSIAYYTERAWDFSSNGRLGPDRSAMKAAASGLAVKPCAARCEHMISANPAISFSR
jgi:N-acetylglucosamine kinase-like BadF-type ATPase